MPSKSTGIHCHLWTLHVHLRSLEMKNIWGQVTETRISRKNCFPGQDCNCSLALAMPKIRINWSSTLRSVIWIWAGQARGAEARDQRRWQHISRPLKFYTEGLYCCFENVIAVRENNIWGLNKGIRTYQVTPQNSF